MRACAISGVICSVSTAFIDFTSGYVSLQNNLPSRYTATEEVCRNAHQAHVARRWPASSLRLRRPVHHDGELQARGLLPRRDEEEAITRRRHRIAAPATDRPRWREIEERPGRARLEAAARLHLHRHQLPVRGKVVQLLAIAPPPRLTAAIGRNLPLATRTGKGLHIH